MAEIIVEVPEELERRAKILNIELKLLLVKIAKERVDELEEIERYEKIVSKSKATEKDVEELSDKINTSMWKSKKQCATTP